MMFNRLFDNGKKLIVVSQISSNFHHLIYYHIPQPLLLTSSLSLSIASYFSPTTIFSDTTPGLLPLIGSHRCMTLGWSAFLVFLNIPYTGLFVLSGVKTLAEAEKREQGKI